MQSTYHVHANDTCRSQLHDTLEENSSMDPGGSFMYFRGRNEFVSIREDETRKREEEEEGEEREEEKGDVQAE
jgi:hypothetical protein